MTSYILSKCGLWLHCEWACAFSDVQLEQMTSGIGRKCVSFLCCGFSCARSEFLLDEMTSYILGKCGPSLHFDWALSTKVFLSDCLSWHSQLETIPPLSDLPYARLFLSYDILIIDDVPQAFRQQMSVDYPHFAQFQRSASLSAAPLRMPPCKISLQPISKGKSVPLICSQICSNQVRLCWSCIALE